MLTIPVGHTLAALREVFGEVAEVFFGVGGPATYGLAVDTGEMLPASAPDQVLVSGIFATGAPVSIHYRGGAARDGDGLFWEINGTEGDIRVSGSSGQHRWCSFHLRRRGETRRRSSGWKSPPHTDPAGRKRSSPGTSPASMPGWHGICVREPAQRRASRMRSPCIASSPQSREQPRPEVASY